MMLWFQVNGCQLFIWSLDSHSQCPCRLSTNTKDALNERTVGFHHDTLLWGDLDNCSVDIGSKTYHRRRFAQKHLPRHVRNALNRSVDRRRDLYLEPFQQRLV